MDLSVMEEVKKVIEDAGLSNKIGNLEEFIEKSKKKLEENTKEAHDKGMNSIPSERNQKITNHLTILKQKLNCENLFCNWKRHLWCSKLHCE